MANNNSRVERLLMGEEGVNTISRVEKILEGTFDGDPMSRVEKLLMEGGGTPGGSDNVEFATDAEVRQIMDETFFGG